MKSAIPPVLRATRFLDRPVSEFFTHTIARAPCRPMSNEGEMPLNDGFAACIWLTVQGQLQLPTITNNNRVSQLNISNFPRSLDHLTC